MEGIGQDIQVKRAYKRNPSERNLCSGTSIGGNFNCSLTPVFESNLNCEAIAPSVIPKSDRTANISFSEWYSCRASEPCWGLADRGGHMGQPFVLFEVPLLGTGRRRRAGADVQDLAAVARLAIRHERP